ncbi:hypothetical protein AAIA71_16740 [Vibrio harveyi]|uniref:lipopolysaccharide biosynthesis protein n=1 Tax=Vibrio harveyi TaxID=669 RepID=UPI00237F8168|nr:hypothetical protein [Vibrio harveyi]HDM8070131.1 hypothetical protein [Vibrio harveyi]
MSRVSNVIRNSTYGLSFLVLSVVLNFFSRKIFLEQLGSEFLGLFSTITVVVAFISVVEFGVKQSMLSTLYPMVSSGDNENIVKTLNVMASLYRYVIRIFLFISIMMILPLYLAFSKLNIDFSTVLFLFSALVISSLSEFRISHKSVMFYVEQRNYIITRVVQSIGLLKVLFQIILVYYPQSYYTWISCIIISSLIHAVYVNYEFNKSYSHLKINRNIKIKEIYGKEVDFIKKIKSLNVHRLSGLMMVNSGTLYFYWFSSLTDVAMVGNYTLIFNSVAMILTILNSSIAPSVGSVISENDKSKSLLIYFRLNRIRIMVATLSSCGFMFYTELFIREWLGESYVLSSTVLYLMILNLSITTFRDSMNNFIEGYGLFGDTKTPIIEIIVNTILSVFLGMIYSIEGVLLASVITNAMMGFVLKPHYVFKYGFNININEFYYSLAKSILLYSIFVVPVFFIASFVEFYSLKDYIIASVSFMSFVVFSYICILYYKEPFVRSKIKDYIK